MAVGFAPEEEEDVAGPNPANAAPPPEDVPAPEAPAPDQGDQLATPEGAASPSTMEAPAPVVPTRPTRPELTGDLQQDLKNNLLYSRSLEDWHDAQQAANTSKANDLNTQAAKRQLEEDTRQQNERKALLEQQKQERESRQAEIDAAVKEKMAAQQAKPQSSLMGRIGSAFAIMAGGLGAGLSAAGGHPTANLALEEHNKQLDREYEQLKERRMSANDAVLQARYGYKDTLDNQRAAMNDLDADFSARHKILADQAAYELQRNGLTPEQIAQNELVSGNLQKAAQYEGNIHMREMEAQRKNEDEQRKKTLDVSTIARNNAQADAASALADYRRGRTHAPGTGKGTSKAATKAQEHEIKDIEAAGRDEGKVLLGSARSQGAKIAYESAAAVANELRRAAATGNPDDMKIAVMHAQEQSTRFLTGAAPTQQTFEIQHGLAGSTEQLESRIAGLMGQPTEAKSYVMRMAKNIDAIARQRKEVLTQEGDSLKTRLESIVKSDEGRRRAQGILDSYLGKGAVTLGGASQAEQEKAPQITKEMINKAKGAYDDPAAPVEAKRAAAKILQAAGVI